MNPFKWIITRPREVKLRIDVETLNAQIKALQGQVAAHTKSIVKLINKDVPEKPEQTKTENIEQPVIKLCESGGALAKITVVITNCKRHEFLKACFKSVVDVGIKNIVVTSSSVDAEMEKIHSTFLEEKPDTIIVSETGDSGCNANWLAGIKAAKTEWVAILHDDELMLPDFKRLDNELDSQSTFLLWNARRHGMGYDDALTFLHCPTGIYSSKKLLSSVFLMQKDTLTIAPTAGCFKRADLIEILEESQANFKDDFHITPTMMVGNDLLIWLRSIQKHRTFKYINATMVSFGHHPGSATCDDMFNNRNRLAPIYNKTRDYYMRSHPKIVHVVSRYYPNDADTGRRLQWAEQSWDKIYESGMVEPVHIWNLPRDSSSIGDDRRTHFLKDILKAGMEKARYFDYVMLTNDDSIIHPDLPFLLLDFMLDEQAVCAFRRTFKPGGAPILTTHIDFPDPSDPHDPGRDLFCFTRRWLEKHLHLIPDYVLGSGDWDSTLSTVIRLTKGITVTDQTWIKRDKNCEIPGSFLWHEHHLAAWSTDEARKTQNGNLYNRELTKRFIAKHRAGWFIE